MHKSINEKKVGHLKNLEILTIVCVVYAWLIPNDILSEMPSFLIFIEGMESFFPAIKGFGAAAGSPEMARFYFSTMWIAFPLMYCFIRWKGKESEIKFSTIRKKYNAVASIFVLMLVFYMFVLIMGLNEVKSFPLRNLATGGRGYFLYSMLTKNGFTIGIFSAICWWIMFFVLEICVRSAISIFKSR
jgi:hypothetical protein